MPIFEIETPQGTFEVDAPNEQQALEAIKQLEPQPSTAGDVLKGGLSGLLGGAADMADSLPLANIPQTLGKAMGVNIPNVREATDMLVGHDPQTTMGSIAKTAGEFASNAAVPGGLLKRGAAVVAPTIGAEAGERYGGTPGRVVGSLVGAMTPVQWSKATTRALKQAAKNSAHQSGDEMKQTIKAGYDALRDAGYGYSAEAYAQMLHGARQALLKAGFHPTIAKQAHGHLDDLAKSGDLDFGSLDAASSAMGKVIRGAYKAGNDAEAASMEIVKDALDNFAVNPVIKNTDIPDTAQDMAQKRASLRSMVRRQKKAETVEGWLEIAEASTSGFVSGLNNEISKELKKGKKSMFNDMEKALLRDVQSGKQPWQKIPIIAGVFDPTGGIGASVTTGLLGRQITEGFQKKTGENLSKALRNPDLGAEALKAKRESERDMLRRILGGIQAVTP